MTDRETLDKVLKHLEELERKLEALHARVESLDHFDVRQRLAVSKDRRGRTQK